MMSNLSSIYNTIGRQAESLGKPAAVHTLHNTKSMPLRKETPGKLVVCPAAPWTVKYLHFRAFPCLVPAAWEKKRCPWGGSFKNMPTIWYTLPPRLGISCANPLTFASRWYHNLRNPTCGSSESWNAPLTSSLEGATERQSHVCSQNTYPRA